MSSGFDKFPVNSESVLSLDKYDIEVEILHKSKG